MSAVLDTPSPQPAVPASLRDFVPPARGAIQKVRYTHDAMIDLIVQNPWISQGALAENFGYSEGWVSQVIASDAFQSRLAERRKELVDPTIRATLEERFKGLVVQSLQKLQTRLEGSTFSNGDLVKVLEVGAKALGYGAKQVNNTQNVQFVVQVPGKAASSSEWARAYSPSADRVVADVPPGEALEPAPQSLAREAPTEHAAPVLEPLDTVRLKADESLAAFMKGQ